ncbi:single-stranded DNA-binding protein [bacterium]|nr:single-stranded DNA-binding protein [bacterium]MBU1937679.1 single-stranded DNA-binding protein [bacterium]
MAVNRVILIGNLGKDPEIKFTPSGVAVAKFPLATSTRRKDAEGNYTDYTEWHNIVLWKRQAEVAGEYLKKGMMVYIEGRIQTRSWEDDQGQKRYMTEIVGERMQMFPRKSEGDQATAPKKEKTEEAPPEEEEDLPF